MKKIYIIENNKNKYTKIYKSIKLLELNPKKIVGNDEFTDMYFKKLDEIDELIIGGENLDYIVQKFNLEIPNFFNIDESGKNNDSKIIEIKFFKSIVINFNNYIRNHFSFSLFT